MSVSKEQVALWQEKPGLQGIESLVAQILPVAVESVGGVCEARGHTFELALPESFQADGGDPAQDRVTAFTEFAGPELPHIGLAHPLILGFSDRVLESAPIDIVELTPFHKETPPQRVVEKLSAVMTFRPSKIEITKLERARRVWTQSVYWFGFEAADLGNRLRHFLQDAEGRFLPAPEEYLKRLNLRGGDFQMERHVHVPEELASSLETQVSERLFEDEFRAEIDRVQGEELTKAMTYYDRLEADLRERIAHEVERGAKSAAIQALEGKVLRVQAERDIRLRNIRDRFRAQFKVQPVGARLLILPTYRLRIQPNASSEASALIEYCPVLREFLPVSCPSCRHSTRDLVLKGKQYLCPRCV